MLHEGKQIHLLVPKNLFLHTIGWETSPFVYLFAKYLQLFWPLGSERALKLAASFFEVNIAGSKHKVSNDPLCFAFSSTCHPLQADC